MAEAFGGFSARERVGPANPNGALEPLRSVDPITLQDKQLPEREWVVPSWVPWHQVTMLGGDGGVGKTLVSQQLMTACAVGGKWLGMDVRPCKVFGLFCEDDEDELHRRQYDINQSLGVDFGDLENMRWISHTGGDASLADFRPYEQSEPNNYFHRLMETVIKFGAQLVVIDSLHDVFSGNENDRVHARTFIRMLQDLAQGIDGAVVLNAHPSLSGLSSGSGASGSTAWNNAVRSRLYLFYQDDEEGGNSRILARKKSNYAARGDEMILDWDKGVLAPRYVPTGAVAAMEARNCETVFLGLLGRRGAEGRPVSDKTKAANYAPKEFARRKPAERQGFNKRDFELAMEALFSDGRITLETYIDGSRHEREKIVPTGNKVFEI